MNDHALSPADRADMEARTHEGVERGYYNAEEQWKRDMQWIVHEYALEHETFTVNDIRERISRISRPTHDGRALGGVMKSAQKEGWIEPTGRKVQSVRGHKSLIEIWRSKIYQKPRNASLGL